MGLTGLAHRPCPFLRGLVFFSQNSPLLGCIPFPDCLHLTIHLGCTAPPNSTSPVFVCLLFFRLFTSDS